MPRAVFMWTPEFGSYRLSDSHPLKPERLTMAHQLLVACDAFDGDDSRVVAPVPCDEADILRIHSPEYVEAVRRIDAGDRAAAPWRWGLDTLDNPVFAEMYDSSRRYIGASVEAMRLVASGEADAAFNIAGGLHHAHRSRAAGFCVFNDPAIIIARLTAQEAPGSRVAYLDIDAHHGDGVQEAFYDRSDVLTISLHETGRYLFPGTGDVTEIGEGEGEGYAVNLPLAPFTDDDTYQWAFDQVVPPLIESFRPDFVVAQLGADTHYRDPHTHFQMTTRGYAAIVERIVSLGGRLIAVGGGGYDLDAVARCWALAYGLLAGRRLPDRIPAAVASRYREPTLHDGEEAASLPRHPVVREWAEAAVQALKETVFSYHPGLVA
jgi:acetoin utilization protein AcuC